MDQSQVRWALLKISLVSLAVSSWVFTSFVLETRPADQDVAINMRNSVVPQPEDALKVLARLPASIPAQLPVAFSPQTKIMAPIKMDVLKLGCWDLGDMQPQTVDARWVRLTGRPCQSDPGPEHIEIRNLTNGYAGTVFVAQNDQLTTDFIPLQEGVNEILVRLGQGQGVAYENRLTFVRPLPSQDP